MQNKAQFTDMKRNIAVFAYSFPHKKTSDFLLMLKANGFRNVSVIGAPKVKLSNGTSPDLIYSIPQEGSGLTTKALCENIGYSFIELPHEDKDGIELFLQENGSPSLAIISGARIIKASIIDLFTDGIINLHPGSIPETSGLDSFYWMIKNDSMPGTTIHFIDERVDAGELIFFHELKLNPLDTLVTLKQRLYQNQLAAFKRLIGLLLVSDELVTTTINRPKKHSPMSIDEKQQVIELSQSWLTKTDRLQEALATCFKAIRDGDEVLFEENFNLGFELKKNEFGRTLLAEAAYHHRYPIAEFLLHKGADINAKNDKGTIVLMYAKTKIAHDGESSEGLKFIERLIELGADINSLDCFGKSIFHYIPQGRHGLIAKLRG